MAKHAAARIFRRHIDQLAVVLVTSGTTGTPKAVGLSHRALQNRLYHNRQAIGETAMARTLVTLPTSFGHGFDWKRPDAFVRRGDIVFPPRGATLPRDLAHLIDAHQITFMTGVPALWRMALKMSKQTKEWFAAPCSRRLRAAVGAIMARHRRLDRCRDVNCYGLTEVANWFSGASSRGWRATERTRGPAMGRPRRGAASFRTDRCERRG